MPSPNDQQLGHQNSHQGVQDTGDIALCGWISLRDPTVVETVARLPYRWVGIDLQHGNWDLQSAFLGAQICNLMRRKVLVRVGPGDLPQIPRLLDHGVDGIILAMASDPEVVEQSIRQMHYQPEGDRSFGGFRLGNGEPYENLHVAPVTAFAMIETKRALDLLPELLDVPGLSGVHIGPADLALALGKNPFESMESIEEDIAAIVAAARARGLTSCLHSVSRRHISLARRVGVDEVVLTGDLATLRGGLVGEIAAIREIESSTN